MAKNRCTICRKLFTPSLRHPHQSVCFSPECRRKKRNRWQKQKMKTDPDYRANQRQANQKWRASHPLYYKTYRKSHPEQTLRNRLLQKVRNSRRFTQQPVLLRADFNDLIAKMDVVKSTNRVEFGTFWLIPVIAKMDPVKVFPYYISDG